MQVSKQDVVSVLRKAGFAEAAEHVARDMPESADIKEAAALCEQHGISRDELISRMGGSP